MKKIYFLSIAFSTIAINLTAQTPQKDYLDINNIKAAFWSSGDMFWDIINSKPEFEVPKGNKGKNCTMFASALWIGGVDAGGQLKIAANTYRQTGVDFWPGPLDSNGIYNPNNDTILNKVWKLNKCDIDAYVNWCNSGRPGSNPVDSKVMDVINSWPALNSDGSPLAPFVDVNGDGIYDPNECDYPKIKGDQALFFVFNDKGGMHTETGGQPIGLEIQTMAYAYNCTTDSALYNTIFTSHKIINKSRFQLDSTFVGFWTDFDLGYYLDDYLACDVTRSAIYVYNADTLDGNTIYNYGNKPPAQAVVFLAGPWADTNSIDDAKNTTPNGLNYGDGIIDNERLGLCRSTYYNNDFTVMGNPTAAIHYYNYLTGKWKDGTNFNYGGDAHTGTYPSKYIFPGDSDPLGYGTNFIASVPWTAIGTPPGDKRIIGSSGPFTSAPGSINQLDLAYVFARTNTPGSNSNMVSVEIMKERIDSIRNRFNSGRLDACMCNNTSTGIKKLTTEPILSIYPNPATSTIVVKYSTSSKNYNVNIYDASGKIIKSTKSNIDTITIDINDLADGIYLLNVYDENNSSIKRFVKH